MNDPLRHFITYPNLYRTSLKYKIHLNQLITL